MYTKKQEDCVKTVVISGSTRNESASLRVSEYLKEQLIGQDSEAFLIDLHKTQLPFYNDTKEGAWQSVWLPIEQEMAEADAFVIVSPEWDGMFSAALHNMFNYAASASDKKPMAHKPVVLVGVSSGMGGAYPISQMKSIGSKNTLFVVIPENLRFANVNDVLVDGVITVDALKEKVAYSMKVLAEYAHALKSVRESGVLDLVKFKNGS
jgi:NAD(P)H-dependent FMN reductase